MLIYRITLTKYSDSLIASGRAARWNSNGVFVIYTAGSISLACLENVVNRNGTDLSIGNFFLIIIKIPDSTAKEVSLQEVERLHPNWYKVDNEAYLLTQRMGDNWIKSGESLLMKVPSSIIPLEYNYLINQHHPDFSNVRIVSTQKFIFDQRIKMI